MQDRLHTRTSQITQRTGSQTYSPWILEWQNEVEWQFRHVNAEEKSKGTGFTGGCVDLDIGTGGKVPSSATDRPWMISLQLVSSQDYRRNSSQCRSTRICKDQSRALQPTQRDVSNLNTIQQRQYSDKYWKKWTVRSTDSSSGKFSYYRRVT